MHNSVALALFVGAVGVFPSVAFSQVQGDLTTLTLDQLLGMEVVEAASRYEQRINDAPASVTIVTAEEIARHGYQTLGDVLGNVRGMYVSYDRNYQYLGVRGFGRPGDYNGRVLVMIDGHRLNDNLYGSVLIDSGFQVDLSLVDRIEIVRGPGSSLYGTNGVFAVVNVVTKALGQSAQWSVSSEASSFTTGRAGVSLAKSFPNSASVLLAAHGGYSRGQDLYFPEFDAPETNFGLAEHADTDRFRRGFGKVSFGDLTFEGAYVSREKAVPTAPYGTLFGDSGTRTVDSRAYVEMVYRRRFASDGSLVARFSFDRSGYDGRYVYAGSEPGSPRSVLRDHGHGEWLGMDVQHSQTVFGRHRVTVGTEWRWDFEQEQGSYDETEVYLDDARTSAFVAAFVQDAVHLAPGVNIHAGIRYDHYPTFGGTASPRVALLLTPGEHTTLKLQYGLAFRAPTAYELYYQDGGRSSVASLNLRPEHVRSYEASLEQGLGPWVRATVAAYDYRIEDLIAFDRTSDHDLLVFRNVDSARGRGVEFELRGSSALGVTGIASYVYQRTRDSQGQELSSSPRHLAIARLTIPLASQRVFLGANARYVGARLGSTNEIVKGSPVGDLTVTGVLRPQRLEFSVSVYNIFDSRHADPATPEHRQIAIPQDGRNWRVGFNIRF